MNVTRAKGSPSTFPMSSITKLKDFLEIRIALNSYGCQVDPEENKSRLHWDRARYLTKIGGIQTDTRVDKDNAQLSRQREGFETSLFHFQRDVGTESTLNLQFTEQTVTSG